MLKRICKLLVILCLTPLFLLGCKDTNLSEATTISSGNGQFPGEDNDNENPGDTTAPSLSGTITDSSDSGTAQGATSVWSVATDDVAVSHYEIAIAEDDNGTCNSSDFSSPTLNWTRVPDETDFSGAGYQAVNGNNDGNSQSINLNLKGDQDYCTAVRAVDSSGNTSSGIYSASPWNFLYLSCLEALNNEPGLNDGVYNIDPDGVGGEASFAAFCDMSTQGGGWTLVMRYDANQAGAANYFMPTGSARSQMNISDIQSLNGTGNLNASANFIPFIQNGATMLMHVGKPDDAATDSSTYARIYFSDIYQAVIDNPSNIFDSSLDTDNAEAVSGAMVNGVSAVRKDRWYESDMSVMTVWDTDGDTAQSYRINGGEGNAMFTNGSREGAVYCTGATSGGDGHGDPKVQWGFAGKDGTGQTYGGVTYIGTHCSSALACPPENPINLMFIR